MHLGVAMAIHPFVLQCIFRSWKRLVPSSDAVLDDNGVRNESLSTFIEYQALVDANALMYIWPADFSKYRICIFSVVNEANRTNGVININTANIVTFRKEVSYMY